MEAIALADASMGLKDVVLVTAFRALPFAFWMLLATDQPWPRRVGLLSAYGLVVFALDRDRRSVVLASAVGLMYYGAVVFLLHFLSRREKALAASERARLFILSVGLFLVVPGTVMHPVAHGSFQIWGWELTFKAYSYLAETHARTISARESMFFYLVDPAVVYPRRARRLLTTNGLEFKQVPRLLLGIGAIALFFIVLRPFVGALREALNYQGQLSIVTLLSLAALTLLGTYARHSGVASIQIATLRMLGYSVQERYRYPLAATSPADFWRRWNTYIGEWAHRYLYLPMATRLLRRAHDRRYSFALAIVVIVTFALIGFWHDFYQWLERHNVSLQTTVFFIASAVLLLVWEAIAQFASMNGARSLKGPSGSILRRLVFLGTFLCLIAAFE